MPNNRIYEDRRLSLQEINKRHYLKKRTFVEEYKAERGCANCGEKDHIVLDLHHPNPADKNPRLKKNKGTFKLSWGALKEELEKCVVLCANCHRRLHAV